MSFEDPDPERVTGDDREVESDAAEDVRADPVEVERLANRILHGLELEVQASVRDAELTIEVEIGGADRDYLLERKGEALDAMQYLLNRIIYRGRRGKKIHVDSGGFRSARENEIVEIAIRTAEKVKTRGEESLLSPLNPYERRLVHIALSEISGVETRSVGDGFLKRVAIFPTGHGGPGGERTDS